MAEDDVSNERSEVGANGGHFGHPRHVALKGRAAVERRLGTVGMGDRRRA